MTQWEPRPPRVKTLWFPRKRLTVVGQRESYSRYAMYPTPGRYEPVYEKRWFKAGQRVEITQVEFADDGGIENLFLPFALFNVLAQRTKWVDVYRLMGEDE